MDLELRKNCSRVAGIRHIPELDGIRGIAILLVLFYHSHVPIFIDLGWSGVDLFFVLSGFLITSILLNTKGSSSYFSSFYFRRMVRIFPLYFSFLFAYFCIMLPLAHHFGQGEEFTSAGQSWYWLYLQNWRSGAGHDVLWLSHFWSLAVEEQFYLVWPFLVFLLSRRAVGYCSALTIVGCLLLRVMFVRHHAPPEVIHRFTVFRIDSLAMGGLVAVLVECGIPHPRIQYPALSCVLLMGIALYRIPLHSVEMLTVGFTGVAIASAYLVFYAVTSSGSSDAFCCVLRNGLLRRLGKYSYGIYVLHLPIVRWLAIERDAILNLTHYQPDTLAYRVIIWLTIAIGCVASYGAALLSWYLVEERFVRLKAKFGYDTSKAKSVQEQLQFVGS